MCIYHYIFSSPPPPHHHHHHHHHHQPGLTMHATVLAYMFSLVERDKIKTPLYSVATVQASGNADYTHKFVSDLLKQAFPHLQE